MPKQHGKQFKLDAVQYYQDHKNLGVRGCTENLGVGYSTLTKWLKSHQHSGKMTEAIYLEVSKKRKLPKNLEAGFPSPEC